MLNKSQQVWMVCTCLYRFVPFFILNSCRQMCIYIYVQHISYRHVQHIIHTAHHCIGFFRLTIPSLQATHPTGDSRKAVAFRWWKTWPTAAHWAWTVHPTPQCVPWLRMLIGKRRAKWGEILGTGPSFLIDLSKLHKSVQSIWVCLKILCA